MLLARDTNTNDIWVEEDVDAAAVIAANNVNIVYYSITNEGGGIFSLQRQRVQAASEVTEEVVISATLEDDV